MRRLLKWGALGLAGVAATGVLSFALASAKANARLNQKFEVHRVELPLPHASDAAAVARGKHLVEARYGCSACHGKNLGGGVMIDDAAIGTVLGPNLTTGRGSHTSAYTMADWDRTVRHGVKPDGSPAVMPSEDYFRMSDAELADIVAYARSLPPVDATTPAASFGPVGKVLLALGKFPLGAELHPDHSAAHAAAPPEATDSVEFGAHLAAVCTGCHRANLAGGKMPFGPPDWPVAANLTPHADGLGGWSFDDFERAITEGIRKDGQKLRPPMAELVPAGKQMLPTERRALWTYLRSLPATARNE